jgi:hypothetical protein
MTKHSPFRYIKFGSGLLNYLVEVQGPGAKSHVTISNIARTHVLLIVLAALSWHWMDLLGQWDCLNKLKQLYHIDVFSKILLQPITFFSI